MVASNFGRSSGFSISAPTPAASAGKSWLDRAVRTIIGRNGCSVISRSNRSHPFWSGRFKSSSAKSTAAVLATSRASPAFAARNTL